MSKQVPLFITARFRSGSTLLWHIFDQAKGYHAYYEPCHDNLLAHIRYTLPMDSHRGVQSYWASYQNQLPLIENRHQPEFGLSRLLLEAHESWDELKFYLQSLLQSAAPAIPVLQFNRIDFRLPWIRTHFPTARIVHLYRDSRDSYFSMTRHLAPEAADNPGQGHVYDLLEWSVALAEYFPFLADPGIQSLYERHYYFWKLSYLMGRRCSDLSLSYDADFRDNPALGLEKLSQAGYLDSRQIDDLGPLIQPQSSGQWAERYAESWFQTIEKRCEQMLDELGLNAYFGRLPLAEIKKQHAAAWSRYEGLSLNDPARSLLMEYSRQRSEVTRLLFLVRNGSKDCSDSP
ncbi:sulfotransferase [Nitrosococcus watsonii]|nr:sulfotransferase [Nitrosococcus watsonii]